MTPWALIADIHGNLAGLRRALDHARERGANRIACLGDILSGPEDEACCRLIMENADLTVFGNRDVRVRMPYPEDMVRWVRSLRASARLDGILLVHSSPASPFPLSITVAEAFEFRRDFDYWTLYPFISGKQRAADAIAALDRLGHPAALYGHTHRQAVWRGSGEAAERVKTRDCTLGDDARLVGVGSVGQGENGRVEYALYEPETQRVELVSLEP